MSFSSSANSLRLALLLLLIIALATQIKARPSRQRSDAQVLEDLFGVKISSLFLTPSEVSEGSADAPPPLSKSRHGNRVESPRTPPRIFLDFMSRQRKLGGRSRKGVARGCFGMKVDRIGVISGLGC
ncbi:C-type natriuretic peptide 2 [Xyrauchen texanus]|uniref:C-type natriuretic peptide 2 n=1 Tax=Xyrauchen texanus TaxID=154827 RepID=UPI00224270B8|nr:C-type natriuretic peptide 2 [Xyrauchen texanus]